MQQFLWNLAQSGVQQKMLMDNVFALDHQVNLGESLPSGRSLKLRLLAAKRPKVMQKNIETHYVVTGLFGADRDFGVYKAPVLCGVECLFFSNSDVIGRYAETQGWRFIKTFHPSLESDYLESSLQSKWVKYLQFLNESSVAEANLLPPRSVLYFDHKFNVTSEHVANILNRPSDASVVIRKTPVSKESIGIEIEAAIPYERYARHMIPTKSFVRSHLEQGAKNDVTICNTGLIHYRDLAVSRDLANRVYDSCQVLKQPECQIIWAVHAQAFEDQIDVIEWNDPLVADIEWQDPKASPSSFVSQAASNQHEPGHGVVVAGFHRSGTSSVAGMLHKAGVSAGLDLLSANEDNSKGYFESWGLVNIHDRLMTTKGVDWATSLDQKAPLSEDDLVVLRDYFNQRATHSESAWCMKDPRIGRYMFEWKLAAPELKTLLLYRLPNASARSLLRRSLREFVQTRGTLELPKRFFDDPDLALRLWVEHNETYVRFCQSHSEDCVVVGHAAIMNGFDVLQAISTKFGFDIKTSVDAGFLDSTLLSKARPIYVVSEELRNRAVAVWKALCELDVAGACQIDVPQFVEDQLILDIDGKNARAEVLEVFYEAAMREMNERHQAAKAAFWRTNKLMTEVEVHKKKVSELQTRVGTFQEKAKMVKSLEARNILLRFNVSNHKRLGKAFRSYRDYTTLRRTNMFDAEWYLDNNPDVKEAGADALKHYLNFGAGEGRDPSSRFSTIRYFSLHEDVLEAGINPLLHYAKFGQKEGREV